MEKYPIIIFSKNKKFNKIVSKIIFALNKDVSYHYGGWLFFGSRMITNAIFLYFTLIFIGAFFMFVFQSQGIIEPEQLEVINTILWAVGVIYLIMRIPTWKEELKNEI